MRIGVTVRFQNSYFSGSIQQVACSIARTCAIAGHDVSLLRPKEDADWFIDVKKYGEKLPPRVAWDASLRFDLIVEVCWSLTPAERASAAKKVVLMTHYPPIFHDTESCAYMWNPTARSFENLAAIWMYDFYGKQDAQYLELLSRVPVISVPYVWDADALDLFVEENNIPTWAQSAKTLENSIPKDAPKSMSWCARVVESNFSNTSHCIIPLNIISQIRVCADPIRFSVHNGEKTGTNEFFKSNIVRNLTLPDISGNMVPRVRLPDLRRDKVVFIAHQRFRPFKSYMLDAMYLGMPMIHNSSLLKNLGAPYYYELNQISQGVDAWNQLKADYAAGTGFFAEKAHTVRQIALRARYGPESVSKAFNKALESVPERRERPVTPAAVSNVASSAPRDSSALRVAFCNMWDQFQPKHNFFMYLLAWIGQQNGVRVVHDALNPNVVFFGPFSNGEESKYPGVPKVYFTGENAPPNAHTDTFLNLGFQYNTAPSYIRLPLWVCEINWWGADVEKVINPRYVSVKDATTVDTAVLDSKQKFCAFVATNPNNPNRNGAFQALNKWRPVDSGGRLFCNMPSGPIPSGLGGGGGELAKVEFYKKYKFALTFENSSSPGYTTEKLFHAKVAGCVPIYWGDAFVDRDFDSRGFINVNQAKKEEDLIEMVSKIADNETAWRKMAAVPAVSEFKRRWCERTMEEVGKRIFKRVLSKDVMVAGWDNAQAFGALYESDTLGPAVAVPAVAGTNTNPPHLIIEESKPTAERIFVTAANTKFVEAAANLLKSLNEYEPAISKIVYVWPDVSAEHRNILKAVGASEIRELPTETEKPWTDFWEVQHFAWKLWVHADMQLKAPTGASVLYLDAGVVIAAPIAKIWTQIESAGAFILNDDEQTNERWCHPTFCEHMKMTAEEGKGNQITAGLIGFKVGATTVSAQALAVAKENRDVIVGDKWKPYGGACMGHRHDQSILSLLTMRHSLARVPLRSFYCDKSMRAAQQWGTPLYVHRGHFRSIVPFTEGIDEAYVINLERREDRLQRFKSVHPAMKDRTYIWRATDGRSLTLTPELVHCFRNNDFKWKKAVMGCALSHLGLWEKLANDPLAKSYLIMEDDVVLDKQWMLKWVSASTQIPKDADVIYLGGVLPPNKPAVPTITEVVNKYFARVAKNALFGGPERRYFHFCNYAYVLTQAGARKLVGLVKERGIFTSGDHMIVNHGDNLLNIYFTTPFVATCFQEDDPIYQKSEFNNFDRVDGFDSDLWNNKDAFTLEEVKAVSVAAEPTVTNIWNDFLKQCALHNREGVRNALEAVFEMWRTRGPEEFNKNLSWFRIFEQLILTKNDTLMVHKDYILEKIKSTYVINNESIWKKVHDALEDKQKAASPAITMYNRPHAKTTPVYHMKQINAEKIFETPWLDSLFPDPIEWRPFETLEPLLAHEGTPVILYQKIPGIDVSRVFQVITELLATKQKQIIVLHLSDEFANDPIEFYKHPTVKKVLRNYWRPNIDSVIAEKVVYLPLGYAPSRDGAHLGAPPAFGERTVPWSFVGSLDRPGREEALDVLRAGIAGGVMHAKPQWDSPNLLEAEGYNALMRKTKFVPCFRGSRALESYRLYEALEHGGIPIYVKSESADCEDEYTALLGKHPLLGFADWKQVADNIPKFMARAEVMEKHRIATHDWWVGIKAALRVKVANALRA